jgi:hypothetical protein
VDIADVEISYDMIEFETGSSNYISGLTERHNSCCSSTEYSFRHEDIGEAVPTGVVRILYAPPNLTENTPKTALFTTL